MHAMATWVDGKWLRPFDYEIDRTPCRFVMGRETRFAEQGVHHEFAADTLFFAQGFDAYAARSLLDSSGRPLGLIAVINRKPLLDRDLIELLLRIFGIRAAAEFERQRDGEAVRMKEDQYRAIFNASADALILWDNELRIIDVNPACLKMYRFEREDIIKGQMPSAYPADYVDDRLRLVRRALEGEACHLETQSMRADGSLFDVELRFIPVQHQGVPHVLSISRDVSERRAREQALARSEEQLRQAQKMEAIGHLAGGIAHDFNNLLASIMGYVVLAEERPAAQADAKLLAHLDQTQHACRRARDLIRQMLTFSRGQRGGDARRIALAQVIEETTQILRATMPATIALTTRIDANAGFTIIDPVQAQQVVLNLCINARDAMDGSGRVNLELRHRQVRGVCASCKSPVDGAFLELAVADTGPGVSPQVAERMFEPFFSTKAPGKGSGMGLAMVHGIVHDHGGHVMIDTAPGGGALFRVLLPAVGGDLAPAPAPARKQPAAPRKAQPAALRGQVLLVDDEESVLGFMRELLESWGLKVRATRSPLEAQIWLARKRWHCDLLLTDQAMPGLTGLELARGLVGTGREVPVVLYSGHAEGIDEDEAREAGVRRGAAQAGGARRAARGAVLLPAARCQRGALASGPSAEGPSSAGRTSSAAQASS